MAGKKWSIGRRLEFENAKLARQNNSLGKKIGLTEKTIENSLSGLASGLGARGDFAGGMSPLASFNPTLQNNMYAPITLMWTNLMYMYKTHGLLQTSIDMPVLDALRGGIEIQSDGQLDADDIKLIEHWMEENSILERIGDAFIWARLFGGGALIVNSEADSQEPLGDEMFEGNIEFYDASRWELTCDRRIPTSGKYGYYGKQLDSSRVLTILGKRAPWLIRAQLSDWGMSELERVIEDFNIFLRTRNVIYELLEEAKVDVYSLKGFRDALLSPNGTALTTRRIQTMNQIKNFNNALILDKEDDYQIKQIGFGGLAEMMKENRMGLASAFRMPMSKLFGIPSTGYSSGEDDIENYNGMVESEVRQPMKIIIAKVLKIVVKHLFHEDLDINFNFKPLRVLSSTDEETIKTSKFNRIAALYDKNLMSSKEVGEAIKKDNLIPIPLEAEKGLLDDHPMPEDNEVLPTEGEVGDQPEGAAEAEQEGALPGKDIEPKPLNLPAGGGSGKAEAPKKPASPEKPKLNERRN